MAMLSLDLNPSPAKLRQFGMIAPVMLVLIGWILKWRLGLSGAWPIALGSIGIALFLLSRISHRFIRPVYLGMIIIGFPIGWVVSHLLMLVFYFGIFTPIALFFRLTGRDLLHRKPDKNTNTYWTASPQNDNVERYFRQF